MSDFKPLAVTDLRPLDVMTGPQVAVLVAIDNSLQIAGLILTCPRCAFDGYPRLETNNHPSDELWKMDCRCRRRRANPKNAPYMKPSGDLFLLLPEMLPPLSLDVRCPSKPCLNVPLKMRHTAEGLLVTCNCGGKYLFRKQAMTTSAN